MQDAAQSCSQKRCCGDNYGQGSGLATGKDSSSGMDAMGRRPSAGKSDASALKCCSKPKIGELQLQVCATAVGHLCTASSHCTARLSATWGAGHRAQLCLHGGSHPVHQQSPPRAVPAPPEHAWRVKKLPSVTLLNNWLIVLNSFAIHCDNVNQDELIEPSHCTHTPRGIPPPFRD